MSQFRRQTALGYSDVVSQAPVSERVAFLRRTYLHLAGAVLAFMAVEFLIFQLFDTAALSQTLVAGGKFSWLLVLGAFMAVSWVARTWANSDTSRGLQYAGLGLYVLAEAVIFVPILTIATVYYQDVIGNAAIITLLMFGCVTAFVFATGRDFSWMGGILAVAGVGALIVIAASILFGFSLGLVFTVLMIALACGYILYDTSNVLHHYRTDQHVAASLALFASVALLFWYVLRLVMAMQRR